MMYKSIIKKMVRIACALALLLNTSVLFGQDLNLKIMSFNIQQPFGTNWDARKAKSASILKNESPDVIGTQEAVNYQRDYLIGETGYAWFGTGRDGGDAGEGSWIFYKSDKYTLDATNSGNFWLSTTPTIPSRFGGAYNRICTFVRLVEKTTGQGFYLFNAHFPTPDLYNERLQSMKMLVDRISKRTISADPIYVTGDFNSNEQDGVTTWMKSGADNPIKFRDTYRDIDPMGAVNTGFGTKFDYIYCPNTSKYTTVSSKVISSPADASDHFPIVATVKYANASIPPVPISIPGKVEAEAYSNMLGVQAEATNDAGGGSNVGFIETNDWMEYDINVGKTANYDFAFRTASANAGGSLLVSIDGKTVVEPIVLPITNDWQIWKNTIRRSIPLTKGIHKLKLQVINGGFNINYVDVTESVAVGSLGYLHADGKNFVNNNGNFQIRAINIGNYMVQEGYMLNLGGGYQYVIKQKIADVVGNTNMEKFYDDYKTNYLTKADIDSIAKWGFNSIRLPMHYNLFTELGKPNVFIEKGFTMVDQIISWCKANNIYVILDLHAAPGGQNSGDISDYIAGQSSLWEDVAGSAFTSAQNRAQTVALWKEFARRYSNEETVGGYDLINETNWTLANNNLLLANLMKDITAAIRTVDNNHILFIEGNSYANDYNGLTPKWDNNMAYSFHKYWNDVTDASLNFIFQVRDTENVPIWLGEFGENSNHWIGETVELMNKYNISWAIWPYKKMGSVSGALAFKEPANWSALATYIKSEGAKPSAATGQVILDEMVQNVKLVNCSINRGYLSALFPDYVNPTKPFEVITLPSKVSATRYDEGKNGVAYSDVVFRTTQFGVGGGDYTAWNTGWYFRNDGVDIQYSNAEKTSIVAWTEDGEWMNYTVNVSATANYLVKARVAGNGGKLSIAVDGTTVIDKATVSGTGDWDTWKTVDLGSLNLTAGKHTIKATFSTAGFNISYFDFINPLITSLEETNVDSFTASPTFFFEHTNLKVSTANTVPLSIKATDCRGMEVYSSNAHTTNEQITFGHDLAPGLYVLRFVYQNKVETVKVVKQ